MLFFIKVEKNRMIPITSMEPMNAPIMTDRNPDKVKTPAVIVPAPASMTKATPKLAPELIPSMEGSAKGLLNVVCNISPDAASAIPQRRAVMACGRRDSQTMKLQLAFSTSLPVRICHTASAGMFTEPNNRLAPVNARMRRSSMIPYFVPLLFIDTVWGYAHCRECVKTNPAYPIVSCRGSIIHVLT